jgi:hypothetical protein
MAQLPSGSFSTHAAALPFFSYAVATGKTPHQHHVEKASEYGSQLLVDFNEW